MKFTKKPVTIEAVPVFECTSNARNDWNALPSWLRKAYEEGGVLFHGDGRISIETLEGTMHAEPNDWIIQGVKGELYPCKPDVFEATYEPHDPSFMPEAEVTLAKLQQRAHETAQAKGWHDSPRDDGTFIALMHSELSEALEELRGGHSVAYVRDGKPEGVGIELADCIIRILDFCALKGIDLEAMVLDKMDYNDGRSYRHGGKHF